MRTLVTAHVPNVASRDWQLRPARVLCFELASLAWLTTPVAEELTVSSVMECFTRVGGLVSVDFVCVSSTRNGWFNVETWPCPAYGSWVGIHTACPVSLKSRLYRVHAWRAMPFIPRWDPLV